MLRRLWLVDDELVQLVLELVFLLEVVVEGSHLLVYEHALAFFIESVRLNRSALEPTLDLSVSWC